MYKRQGQDCSEFLATECGTVIRFYYTNVKIIIQLYADTVEQLLKSVLVYVINKLMLISSQNQFAEVVKRVLQQKVI